MNWSALDNCIAYLCIALVAVCASSLNVDATLASSAIAAIAGLAGRRLPAGNQPTSTATGKELG